MPIARDHLDLYITQGATVVARIWAQLVRAMAPRHLAGNVMSSVRKVAEGEYSITLSVHGADARAQEYGSGLKAQRGVRHKISIRPKEKKALAFFWAKNPDGAIAPILPDGRTMLGQVLHPGIEPYNKEGYIRPSIRELPLWISKELAPRISQATIEMIREQIKLQKRAR